MRPYAEPILGARFMPDESLLWRRSSEMRLYIVDLGPRGCGPWTGYFKQKFLRRRVFVRLAEALFEGRSCQRCPQSHSH